MENMEIVLELPKDTDKLCRTCMNLIDNECTSNFVILDNKQTELCGMLQTVTSLKVTMHDGLPKSLCSQCTDHLKTAYVFILQCTEADKNLKELLQSNEGINGETSGITQLKDVGAATSQIKNEHNCNICAKSYTTYYELSMHLITHNTLKHLTERFAEASTKDNSYIHLQNELDNQKLFIDECRRKLTAQYKNDEMQNCNLKKVTKKENDKDFQCENVNQDFQCLENFDLQISKENNIKHKVTQCNLCGKECKDLSSLSLHFLNHSLAYEMQNGHKVTELYFCEYCGQLFDDDTGLNSHYMTHHNNRPSWKCSECVEVFDKEKDFLNHSVANHGCSVEDDFNSNEAIQCVLCSDNFNSKSELHKHSITHLMKSYKCRKCSVNFCTQNSYSAHLEVHSGGKHVCSLCGKSLSTNSALKSHIEGVHSVDLQHCCSFCGKRFATITRLKSHSKIHTSDKKYICSYCGYSSHKSGDLVMHTRIHTSERPYKCTFVNCTMSFKTSSHLCHHVRRHLQIKRFKCSICLMKFSTNHGLKVHQMQHTGEKPHLCIVCKRTFRRKYHLKVHMKQHSRT